MTARKVRPATALRLAVAAGQKAAKGRTVLEVATGKGTAKRGAASFAEFAEQALFAAWCERVIPMHFAYSATMTGINLPIKTAVLAKRKGVKRGQPDWMLYAPSASIYIAGYAPVGLALEFKSPTGKGQRSGEQEAWASALHFAGWAVHYPTTAIEAERIVCDYLGLPAMVRP